MFLIDTHAHLNFEDFDKDREEVIRRAFEGGIKAIINVGTNFESSKKSIELAERYENIYASVSLHPIDVEKEEFNEEEWLKLAAHPKVVAIGETGFDFYHHSDRKKQKEIFEKLIKIACKVEKPLILHSREADEEVLQILRENKLPSKRGVIHCFGRDYEVAKKFLDLGFLISYTGNITYNKERAISVSEVPLDKIMVETDCPFMTPVPFRGRRNEPLYVKYIAQRIAEIKNITFEEVAEKTTKNAEKLFKIR
ncbi:MAG: hydrolase TatD [Candidatus Nealsonbacteria bacterium]|nr:MAG: hydrolase TatD [Candidatus Nealsonbacteria bacterium]